MSLYTSILAAGANNHAETSENANALATDNFTQGIIGDIANTSGVAPSTGGFAINAQSTPNMTVAVTSGVAYVTGTPTSQGSQLFRVKMTANQNVTISANSSGSTKYDFIYLSLDGGKLANPATNADDVASFVVSRSSSPTSDNGTPPTYGLLLGVVTVGNSATSIVNNSITDKRIKVGFSGTAFIKAPNIDLPTLIDSQNASPTNGYIRYVDGTMRAWRTATSPTSMSTFNSMYYSDTTVGNWAVPFTFVDSAGVYIIDNNDHAPALRAVSTTSAGIVRLYRPGTSTAAVSFLVWAEGNWK